MPGAGSPPSIPYKVEATCRFCGEKYTAIHVPSHNITDSHRCEKDDERNQSKDINEMVKQASLGIR